MSRLVITMPLFVEFSDDPEELAGQEKEGEPKPDLAALVKYLQDALVLDVDNETHGQPTGAVLAAAGVDWSKATFEEKPSP